MAPRSTRCYKVLQLFPELMTFGHALWVSNLLTLPTDLFPGRQVATASGFAGMGGAIGSMLANLGTGYIAQRLLYQPIFAMAGLMHRFRWYWCCRTGGLGKSELHREAEPEETNL